MSCWLPWWIECYLYRAASPCPRLRCLDRHLSPADTVHSPQTPSIRPAGEPSDPSQCAYLSFQAELWDKRPRRSKTTNSIKHWADCQGVNHLSSCTSEQSFNALLFSIVWGFVKWNPAVFSRHEKVAVRLFDELPQDPHIIVPDGLHNRVHVSVTKENRNEDSFWYVWDLRCHWTHSFSSGLTSMRVPSYRR